MALIKSISGIRGTIGGKVGENLTPLDVVKFVSAYGMWLKQQNQNQKSFNVVIGRDARVSGPMVHQLVIQTLVGLGIDCIDLGLSTTPTVEVAVMDQKASGGIIITASHNPKQWNALKLLNHKGEFIDKNAGETILKIANKELFEFQTVDFLGKVSTRSDFMAIHIDKVLNLDLVEEELIKSNKFKVVVDGVNSTGGVIIPMLLERLGVDVVKLYCEPTGLFAHNPEPLKEHLTQLSKTVVEYSADLGIVVDPDVDRLAFVCKDGSMFGEEYTLVAIAQYVLSKQSRACQTVSNLSSSRALRDITDKYKGTYYASAVGEVNVVEMMKKTKAIIGGEGNGGVIYPALHYGRDAVVGVALFLSYLAQRGCTIDQLKSELPVYHMCKDKIQLTESTDVDRLLNVVKEAFSNEEISTIDGVKIDFENGWVHLRKSNTEPIIRIYSESDSIENAKRFSSLIKEKIGQLVS